MDYVVGAVFSKIYSTPTEDNAGCSDAAVPYLLGIAVLSPRLTSILH